ncbi:Glycerol-3-phosphate acyltransferase, partial [human gut metagenome]
LFNKLLASRAIAKAVEDEARSKKSPMKKRSRTRLR